MSSLRTATVFAPSFSETRAVKRGVGHALLGGGLADGDELAIDQQQGAVGQGGQRQRRLTVGVALCSVVRYQA